MADGKLEAAAKAVLSDAARFVLFDEAGSVLASNFTVNAAELKPVAALFADRDAAIRNGLILGGTRFEVHRHHPPLVYGRTMAGTPETSEGCAVCMVESGPTGSPAYALITYVMPNISARMVPILQQFCQQHLAASKAAP